MPRKSRKRESGKLVDILADEVKRRSGKLKETDWPSPIPENNLSSEKTEQKEEQNDSKFKIEISKVAKVEVVELEETKVYIGQKKQETDSPVMDGPFEMRYSYQLNLGDMSHAFSVTYREMRKIHVSLRDKMLSLNKPEHIKPFPHEKTVKSEHSELKKGVRNYIKRIMRDTTLMRSSLLHELFKIPKEMADALSQIARARELSEKAKTKRLTRKRSQKMIQPYVKAQSFFMLHSTWLKQDKDDGKTPTFPRLSFDKKVSFSLERDPFAGGEIVGAEGLQWFSLSVFSKHRQTFVLQDMRGNEMLFFTVRENNSLIIIEGVNPGNATNWEPYCKVRLNNGFFNHKYEINVKVGDDPLDVLPIQKKWQNGFEVRSATGLEVQVDCSQGIFSGGAFLSVSPDCDVFYNLAVGMALFQLYAWATYLKKNKYKD